MQYVLHTPSWGDADFLRLLKAGLKQMKEKVLFVRHTHEHLSGGKLDYEKMGSQVAAAAWEELEAHPLENNDCERDLALVCYLGLNAPVMRLEAKAGIARFGRNIGRAGKRLLVEEWIHMPCDSSRRGTVFAHIFDKFSCCEPCRVCFIVSHLCSESGQSRQMSRWPCVELWAVWGGGT